MRRGAGRLREVGRREGASRPAFWFWGRRMAQAKGARRSGTYYRRRRFLKMLGQTGDIARARTQAGLSDGGVASLRHDPAYREAWDAAIDEAYARLELLLIDRAVNGVARPVFYAGQQIGEIRQYHDRTAAALLAAHRARGGGAVAESGEEMRAALTIELSAISERLRLPGEPDGRG